MKNNKKIFFDTAVTGLHRDTTLISIGLIADTGETFYAELNDYNRAQIDDWTEENIIRKLCYKPPLRGEDEYWMWDKTLRVRMRGNRREVGTYLADWFQAILGGPLSWIDYGTSKRPKEITIRSIEIWGYCPCYDWVLLNDLWGSMGMMAPKCLYHVPFDISSYLMLNNTNPNIDQDGLLTIYEKGKNISVLAGAKGIKRCYHRLRSALQK